jgi:biotin carboxyl carrier protein
MKLKITVHGVAYEVDVEVLEAQDEMQSAGPSGLPPTPAAPAASRGPLPPPRPLQGAGPPVSTGDVGGVASPIAGTVLEVKVKAGDNVTQGQALLVIEAMKMETAIAAPRAGTIANVLVAAGDSVRETQTLVEFA